MMTPVHNLGFSWLTCIHCPTASRAPDQLFGTIWLQSSSQWIKQVSGYCLKLEYVTGAPEVTAYTSRCSFSAAVIPWYLPIKASRVIGSMLQQNQILMIFIPLKDKQRFNFKRESFKIKEDCIESHIHYTVPCLGVYPESAGIDRLEGDADPGALIVVGSEGLSVLDVRPHFSLQRIVNFDLFDPIGVSTAALHDHCCPQSGSFLMDLNPLSYCISI